MISHSSKKSAVKHSHYKLPFQITALLIVIWLIYWYVQNSSPVNAVSTDSFQIDIRYVEFFFVAIVPCIVPGFLLFSSLRLLIPMQEKEQKRRETTSDYKPKKDFANGMMMKIIVSALLAAIGIALFVLLDLTMVQDIPEAITRRPITLSSQVTKPNWVWERGGYANWHFQFAGKTFQTGQKIFHTGEDVTITYLPHSHFIIEYKRDKAE